MHRHVIVRAVMVMSVLVSVLLVGRPDAAFAHPQLAGAPRTPFAGKPAALPNGYEHIYRLQNMADNTCLKDDPTTGFNTVACTDYIFQLGWGFTYDYTDRDGHEIGTFQNLTSGSCLDDSVYGLRAYYCHLRGDPSRIFQQFKVTWFPGNAVQLQNMATGSCVDNSGYTHGDYCNNTAFQKWRVKFY